MIPRDKMRIKPKPSPEEAKRMAETYITIFADASHCPRTLAYGWAFHAKWGYPAQTFFECGGGVGLSGANEAEQMGCDQAIAWLHNQNLEGKIIVLQCDNIAACEVSNQRLKSLIITHHAKDAYAKHVKGHRSHCSPRHWMNGLCDRKAHEQMESFRGKV